MERKLPLVWSALDLAGPFSSPCFSLASLSPLSNCFFSVSPQDSDLSISVTSATHLWTFSSSCSSFVGSSPQVLLVWRYRSAKGSRLSRDTREHAACFRAVLCTFTNAALHTLLLMLIHICPRPQISFFFNLNLIFCHHLGEFPLHTFSIKPSPAVSVIFMVAPAIGSC